MKPYLQKVKLVLRNPVLRPFEIWAIRAALTALVGYLGIDIGHSL